MSSLLDVLHRRPPRQGLAVAADVVPEGDPVASRPQDAELRLAGDDDAEAGVFQQPADHDGDASRGLDDVAADTEARPPARRWTDPVQTQPAPSAAAPPVVGWQSASGLHAGPVAVVGIAVVLCAGWLAWQNYAPLAAGVAPVDDGGLNVNTPAQTDVPARPVSAPVVATRRPAPRKRIPVAADESTPLAWYDQPALPMSGGETLAVAEPEIRITRGSTADPVFERLANAWQALAAGDTAAAEAAYREILAGDAASVDALLGLGTLAARAGRSVEARDIYRRVQQLEPKNATAAAALATLPGDPGIATGESQLKGMLAEQPDSAELHFALALRFVADDRWPDAQVEFFEAVRHAPRNADYAFNLAVSLDRLGQVQPAANYYQRALELAAGSQQFDVVVARDRLAVLQGREG